MNKSLKRQICTFGALPRTPGWERTEHGPLGHEPPPWARSMDWVHQNMDWVHGPPIFLTPKNTVENNKKIKEVN